MLKKILKIFLWIFGITSLFIVAFFIVVLIFLYTAFSPPAGCDPRERSDACDFINKNYERQFENTKANPFPQNLASKPVFWENASEKGFPSAISVPYIYIKDEHGVWLRYNDGLSFDYFLGEDMPKEYYLYSEDDFSPSDEVRKKEKFYEHRAWNITLKDGKNEIYKQTAHKITRQYIGSFDLHSNPGRTLWFPSQATKNFKVISNLQIPLQNHEFPPKINKNIEISVEKHGKFGGDNVILAQNENIYEIVTAQGKQKIRTSNVSRYPVRYKKQKAVCGDEFCLFIFTDPDHKYCGKIENETGVIFLNLEQKFTARSYSYSYGLSREINGYIFGLTDGYDIDDIVSFAMIPTEFAEFKLKQRENGTNAPRYKDVPTFVDYELQIYAKDGEIINEYCDHYYIHKPKKALQD